MKSCVNIALCTKLPPRETRVLHDVNHKLEIQLISSVARRIWIGPLLCVVCIVYFYLLDRVLFSSAHFSPIFRQLLTVYDAKAAWLAAIVCVLAAIWNRPDPIIKVVEFLGQHPFAISIAATVVYGLGTVVVYHDYPLSMDEYAAVFQSKIFASGQVYAQFPENLVEWLVVRGFNGHFLIASPVTGRVVENYWPGFALLLTPFTFLDVPWLCNASLAGLATFLVYWITVEITGDRRAGGWAMLFTLSASAFAANAISYYSMQAHLTVNLLFAALLLKPTTNRSIGAGLVGSLGLILHNPIPHVLFALPWIFAMALEQTQRRKLLPLLVGYIPGFCIGLGWITLRSGIDSSISGVSILRLSINDAFTWPDLTLMNIRVAALVKMWIWAPPCLLVIAVLGILQNRESRAVRLFTQSAALTLVGYLFVRFDQGHGWGYRYFHSAWGAIPVLAGCAMRSRLELPSRLVCFAGATAILSLCILEPFQMGQIGEFMSQHLAQLPPALRPGNNVYFIHPQGGFYVADMVQQDPMLRDRDLVLVSRGSELDNQMIRQNWPDALMIESGRVAEQWYLGPKDRRVRGIDGRLRFQFARGPNFRPAELNLPSAADH
jgi:hypothetical protein